jgi:hypothetical protein
MISCLRKSTERNYCTDTTVVGLITDDDKTAYREEVRDLAVWCQYTNLSLNVSKTKELIVDYRKRRAEHAPIHINRAVVESVSFKFLSIHITKDLPWSKHSREEGRTMPLPPQEAEKMWHGPSHP